MQKFLNQFQKKAGSPVISERKRGKGKQKRLVKITRNITF